MREGGRKERKGRRKEGTFYTKAGISAGGGTAPPLPSPRPQAAAIPRPRSQITERRPQTGSPVQAPPLLTTLSKDECAARKRAGGEELERPKVAAGTGKVT